MSKHMATSGRNNMADETKSGIVWTIAIALMMALFVGLGENYLARQNYEARVKTQAVRNDIAEEWKETMDDYIAAIGEDYHFEVIAVDDNGVTGKMIGWVDGERRVAVDTVPWDEIEDVIKTGRAYTNAELYSK